MSPIFQYAADLYRDMRQEWDLHLEAEYAKAEKGAHGAMLNSLGRREAIDPYSLLIGPWSRVVKYATPELVEWFESHGRPSPAQFEREWFNSWLGEEPNVRMDSGALLERAGADSFTLIHERHAADC